MAKSARASIKKSNKTKLRARVFKPIEDARAERLSAKLMELASQPKPERFEEMQLDTEVMAAQAHEQQHPALDDDIDMEGDSNSASRSRAKRHKKSPRVHKKRKGKSSSLIAFPTYRKGRKGNMSDKKTKKKT